MPQQHQGYTWCETESSMWPRWCLYTASCMYLDQKHLVWLCISDGALPVKTKQASVAVALGMLYQHPTWPSDAKNLLHGLLMPGQVTFGTVECEHLCLRSAEHEMRMHDCIPMQCFCISVLNRGTSLQLQALLPSMDWLAHGSRNTATATGWLTWVNIDTWSGMAMSISGRLTV